MPKTGHVKKNQIFDPEHLQTLEKSDVQTIYLFGSRAQGLEHAKSDYDYAVLTDKPHVAGDGLYHLLYDILAKISPRELNHDVLDIVFLNQANLELKFHVIRYGRVLYEKSTAKRQDFESLTTLLYADYRPILDEMDRAILESI